jgi:lipid A ethanolaminephosphotransferase
MDNLPLVKIGEDAVQKPEMHNGPRKNLTIVVLGETSRGKLSHWAATRETNPRLKQDDVIYFPTPPPAARQPRFPSVHVLNMPRAHYDEELAHHQEGVLDILQRAGIQVLWNDNDGGCKGACDRVPHQNVTDLKLTGQCIDGECYDEVLFHNLENYIDNLQQDGIIVLHHRQPRPDLLQSLSGAV